MKISCEIIRDILPLYAEDMVSQPTKELVDGHLAGCESCTKELETLRKPQKFPMEADTSSLKRVEVSIRRRRILAILAVLLFVGTMLIGGALLLDATIYFSATEAVQDIQVDGSNVHITWNEHTNGVHGYVIEDNYGNYAVTAWTSLQRVLFPRERVPYDQLGEEVKVLMTREQYEQNVNSSTYTMEDNEHISNFIYVYPKDNSMTLLLDSGNPLPEKSLVEISYNKAYYTAGMTALAVMIFVIGLLFKKKWYGEAAQRIGIFCGCLAVSAVIVNAGQFACISPGLEETLVDSTLVAVPMCLCTLCVRQLILLNRKDKGL